MEYGRAKLDDALRSGNAELDDAEARLEAEAADKPWLRSTGEAPTLDEVRARIEHDAAASRAPDATAGGTPPSPPVAPAPPVAAPVDPGFDMADQQHRADDRLAAIRRDLGLDAEAGPEAGPEDGAPPDA